MDKIKSILKSNLPKDSFDTIFWGEPTKQDYTSAVGFYNVSSWEQKIAIQQRLHKKMQKGRDSKISLAALHLMGLLVEQGNRFKQLANNPPNIDVSAYKSQKQKACQLKFYGLYYKFISKQNQKPLQANCQFDQLPLEQKIHYSELAVNQIKQLIQSELLISQYFQHSKNAILGYMVLDSIMKSISTDLFLMKNFMCQNYELILNEHPFMISLNYIYENLVAFGKKNMRSKLENINKIIGNKFDLVFYDWDADINRKIEEIMKNKDKESREYLVTQICTSKKDMNRSVNPQDQQLELGLNCNMTVDQNDILIQNQEFFA